MHDLGILQKQSRESWEGDDGQLSRSGSFNRIRSWVTESERPGGGKVKSIAGVADVETTRHKWGGLGLGGRKFSVDMVYNCMIWTGQLG